MDCRPIARAAAPGSANQPRPPRCRTLGLHDLAASEFASSQAHPLATPVATASTGDTLARPPVGSRQRSDVEQIGHALEAFSAQSRHGHEAFIVQHGAYHQRLIVQSGADDQARIEQDGAHNDALIEQTGTGHSSRVTQHGQGLSVRVRLYH